MTEPFQAVTQFAVVVDATVEDRGESQLRIRHGLGTPFGKIDDFQAPMPERHRVLRPGPSAVRSPRLQGVGHAFDSGEIRSPTIETHLPAQPAHGEPPTRRAPWGRHPRRAALIVEHLVTYAITTLPCHFGRQWEGRPERAIDI
ncbi:hypothetical protein GCM10010343_13180 [Streptomyces avidinii]|nr:hypothetical protein GCM10010343_13180 [Streptomyces avidinii]